MLAVDPTLPLDIGFQLTVAGTFSIVAFASRIMPLARPLPPPFREAFSVTVAAQVGTVPIVVIGFHVLSWTGLLANTLVLPLLPLLIGLGFLLGTLSSLVVAAAPLGAMSCVLLRGVVLTAETVNRIPNPPLPPHSPPWVAAYYSLLAAAAYRVFRRHGWAPASERPILKRELLLALLVAASALTITRVYAGDGVPSGPYWLGSGDAMLLRSSSMTALIDGSKQPFELLVALGDTLPYQTRTIDLVIVTDPRANNIAGLTAVLQHYRIGEVLDVGAQYPSATYARWRVELRSRHIPVYALRTGAAVTVGKADVVALGPDALYPLPQDSAGMLRVTLDRHTYLIATAASLREQREAIFRPIHLRSDVLVIDGKQDPDPAFLAAVRPSLTYSQATLRTSIPHRPLSRAMPITPPASVTRAPVP
jgi:competence protein ComEC